MNDFKCHKCEKILKCDCGAVCPAHPVDEMVSGKSSKEEVIDFAIRGNHIILCQSIKMAEAGLCSWEEAMQTVAIALSEQNAEYLKIILDFEARTVRPIIIRGR